MAFNRITPQRAAFPGIGQGQENKDSIYGASGFFHIAENDAGSSPFPRAVLGENQQRAGLLSGPQRVPVKIQKLTESSPSRHTQHHTQNYMKATESYRIASTPTTKQTASPGSRSTAHAAMVTPAGDSANIHHFVSPASLMASPASGANPMMTPTRAQSAGRVGTRAASGVLSAATPPARTVPQVTQVTPASEETNRVSTQPVPALSALSAGKRISALASPPGRVATSPGRLTARAAAPAAVDPSPRRPASTGRGASGTTGPSYLQPTASSQMLFSPEVPVVRPQQQQQHAPQPQSIVERSPQVQRPVASSTGIVASATTPTSAQKARPQSLSAHMQAHSEQLMAAVMLGNTPAKSSATPTSSPAQETAAPARTAESARSPASSVPSTAVPKLASPSAPVVSTNPATSVVAAPTSGGKSRTASTLAAQKAVRSAEALSANKAAKLAALAAARSQAQSHHPTAVAHAATAGAARYAQPTHSSAAATAALLVSNPAPKVRPAASARPSQRPGAGAVAGGGVGIAARAAQLHSSGEEEKGAETPTTTPQRSVKAAGIRRPPTAPAPAPAVPTLKRKDSDKQLEKPPKPVHSIGRGTLTIERRAEPALPQKGKAVAGTKPSAAAKASGRAPVPSKDRHAVDAPRRDGAGVQNGERNLSAAHGDSIMQILEGDQSHYQAQKVGGFVPPDVRDSYGFGCELSCVEGGEEVMSLGASSIEFSENNTFDTEASNISLRATTPIPGAAAAAPLAATVATSSAPVGDMQLAVPALSNRAAGARHQPSVQRTASLQLEEGLENLSAVEAPASFSPSNLSNLSAFSQDPFPPTFNHHRQTHTTSGVQGGVPAGENSKGWTTEYAAFFPPEINLVDGQGSALSAEVSGESSGGPARLVGTLNYSSVSAAGDTDASSLLQLHLQNFSGAQDSSHSDVLDMAALAASPLPQNYHPAHHYPAAERAVVGASGTSTVASASDVLNQGMIASMSYSASYSHSTSVTSMPSFSRAPSSALPVRVTRQFSDQSCSLSAIAAADGTTFTSSLDLPNLSAPASVSNSRLQVGSSADSMVSSNVLDRAMIASYSYDMQDLSQDIAAIAASESTTSVSPYLRGHTVTRSDSGFNLNTPVVRANPAPMQAGFEMRTMFAPPAPPEVETSLPLSGDNTLTASQQFDHSVEAIFSRRSGEGARRAVTDSVESLPPPPPPAEEPVPETAVPDAAMQAMESVPSTAERIKARLLQQSAWQFNTLRTNSNPSSPEAPVTQQPSPLSQVPRVRSFESVHSLSLLCSTDSAEVALSAALAAALPSVGAAASSQPSPAERMAAESSLDLAMEDGYHQQEEDSVNLGDGYSVCDADEDAVEEGALSDCNDDGSHCSSHQDELPLDDEAQEEQLSEDDLSVDYDADPSELHHVNASVQSISVSRLGGSAGSTNVSCSYTSSMDELHSVNPQLKCAAWVSDNYPQDSVSSAGTDSRSVVAQPAVMMQQNVYQQAVGIATPDKQDLGARDTARFPAQGSPMTKAPLIVREECYRSSRHADSTRPILESCPDPVAGQLLVMSPGLLSAKKSYRTMQAVFVPLGAAGRDSVDATEAVV